MSDPRQLTLQFPDDTQDFPLRSIFPEAYE